MRAVADIPAALMAGCAVLTKASEERFNLPSEIYWYPTKGRKIRLMTRAARLMAVGDWKRRLNLS